MGNRLWTPEGDVATHERGIDAVSPEEMKVLAALDGIARRLGLVLVCKKCDSSFTGGNTGWGRTWAINCKCREIRAEMRNTIIT